MPRHPRAVLIGLALVGILTVSWPAVLAAQPRYGGTLILASPSDPTTLNMGMTISAPPHIATAAVFDSLLRYDRKMTPMPWLASSWTVSPDGTSYTFKLREGVTWHDGKPFTADDVKFNFETLAKHHTQGPLNFGSIKTIETPDKRTVVIRFGEPFAPFMSFLGTLQAPMAFPKHLYEGTEIERNPWNNKPVGTGAFRFVEWKRGERIVLERNPDYWVPGMPYLDRIVVRILPQDTARIQALATGEITWIPLYFSYPSARSRAPGIELSFEGQEGLGPGVNQLWFNLKHPTLANLSVRRAVAHAIDKQQITQTAFLGFAQPARSVLGSASWAFTPNVPQYPHDTALANDMLDRAGFRRGADGTRFTLRLHATSVIETATKQAQLIRDQLAAVGIKVDLVHGDLATINATVYEKKDFDMYIVEGATFTGPDPHIIGLYYSSKNIRSAWYTNAASYSNAEVDRLFEQAARTVDREARKQLYAMIQDLVLADLPAIPVWEGGRGHLFSAKFAGIPPDPFLGFRYGFEQIWWKEGAAKR